MTCPTFRSTRRGSALILVLWGLIVMGIAVFGVVELVELAVNHASQEQLALEARTLANSGVAFGLSPQLLKDDPLLHQKPSAARSFDVRLGSEGARLNINYLLATGHRDIIENLFTQWGLPVDQADSVADCLFDWTNPGDLRSLAGAKAADYARLGLPQRPTGKPFVSLEEVRRVLGMDLVEKAQPRWRDSFTIWSNGPLDLKEAPAPLIAAVFSLNPTRIALYTKTRDGRDGLPGTADDVPIRSMAELQASLGIDELAMKALANQVELGDRTRRIESVGQAQGVQVMISVVCRLNTSPVQYLSWSEQ